MLRYKKEDIYIFDKLYIDSEYTEGFYNERGIKIVTRLTSKLYLMIPESYNIVSIDWYTQSEGYIDALQTCGIVIS